MAHRIIAARFTVVTGGAAGTATIGIADNNVPVCNCVSGAALKRAAPFVLRTAAPTLTDESPDPVYV
jgi:hypothetical protein